MLSGIGLALVNGVGTLRFYPAPGKRDVRIDWLRGLFDAKRYPWFGDKFVHPSEFSKTHRPAEAATFLSLPVYKPAHRATAR